MSAEKKWCLSRASRCSDPLTATLPRQLIPAHGGPGHVVVFMQDSKILCSGREGTLCSEWMEFKAVLSGQFSRECIPRSSFV